jgi:hypothetical protein
MKPRAKEKKGGPQSPVKPIIDELTGRPRPRDSVTGGVRCFCLTLGLGVAIYHYREAFWPMHTHW